MNKWEKYKSRLEWEFYIYGEEISEFFLSVKRKIWNCGIKLWWYKLWIRKDEFHKSLDLDVFAMMEMDKKQMKKYIEDIAHRRHTAHLKDLEREDKYYE